MARTRAPDHPAHEWFRDRYRNSRAPRNIAESLVALWDGLQLQWLIDPRRDLVAGVSDALEDLLGIQDALET
ncbi:hypothetical protein LCH29_37730 [Streptomyces sp. BRA346]